MAAQSECARLIKPCPVETIKAETGAIPMLGSRTPAEAKLHRITNPFQPNPEPTRL